MTQSPDSRLVPERPRFFSAELAQTIGLEEAILLQHLDSLFHYHAPQLHRGYAWLSVRRRWLLESLPFWSGADLQRLCASLEQKGLLLLEHPTGDSELVFALNRRESTPAPAAAPEPAAGSTPPAPRRGAGLLPVLWSPSDDMLQLLTLNHGIKREFALQQLEDFVLYWRERGEPSHAWENKFRQHVLSRWRAQQQHESSAFQRTDHEQLTQSWYPSPDAMEILLRQSISQQFIEDAVPEFVLYWRERDQPPKAINATFVTHIKRQWARFTAAMSDDNDPRPIWPDWQPRSDVFDILGMSHIDADFARELIPEFILYWQERGDAQASWNTRFLQHVKYHWARTHRVSPQGQANAGQQTDNRSGHTRSRSLEQDLTDRSWAT